MVFSLSDRYKISIITIIIIIIIIKVQTTEVSCWAVKRRVKNTVLDKEGNSENGIVIADLKEQSIMTGHRGNDCKYRKCLYIVLPDNNIQSKSM